MELRRSTTFIPTALLGGALLLAGAGVAGAAPIPADLVITGGVMFDDFFAADTTGVIPAYAGSIHVSGASAIAPAGFSDPMGPTPLDLADDIVETGQGVGAIADLHAGPAPDPFPTDPLADPEYSEFYAAFDFFFDLENTSAADTYEVTFKISFAHEVEATDFDSFADSDFFVTDPLSVPDELFVSNVIADSVFGNEIFDRTLGDYVPAAGPLVSEAGMEFFTLSLAPSDMLLVEAAWVIGGGIFDDVGTFAGLSGGAMSLTVDSVVTISPPGPGPNPVIPEPGTLLLLGSGLIGLAGHARRRSRD